MDYSEPLQPFNELVDKDTQRKMMEIAKKYGNIEAETTLENNFKTALASSDVRAEVATVTQNTEN